MADARPESLGHLGDTPLIFRHVITKRAGICAIVLSMASSLTPSSGATSEEVQKAIDKAQAYLMTHRNKQGVWEQALTPMAGGPQEAQIDYRARQWGGLTSIATYALLASGKNYRDKELTPALNFLLRANIQSTYALGLSSQIALYLPPNQTRTLVKRNAQMLLRGLIQPQPGLLKRPKDWPAEVGFYGYWTGFPNGTNQPLMSLDPRSFGSHQPENWYDRSNSQYGVLGMWALEQAGAEVPALYWEIVDSAWKRSQHNDGGWDYRPDSDVTPSMTAAGVATLFITQDYLAGENWAGCHGGISNPFIERGLGWMDRHIEQALTSNMYTAYGVERIGTASGRKFFGAKDWYQIGADYLVKQQKPDGSWETDRGAIPDTSFGLLFLARGRAPVLMNKLEYATDKGERGISDVWNERPRDLANLAQWVGHEQETYFNWQVVNLKVAPEQLHDAPILYISGSQPLNFGTEDVDRLRKFIEQGGMILGNADCGKKEFANSFTRLGKELFPRYEFRQVSIEDLIWHEQFTHWRVKPKVLELSNGVRKLMVLIPDSDPSRAWQTRSDRTKEAMYALGANLFLYAVDKNNTLKKDETYIVTPDPKVHPTRTIKVARLELGDNPNPEPGGWQRLSAVMHNRFKVDVTTDLVKPEALGDYKIAHLTGTGKLDLTPENRKALKQFVEKGGTLIVDAAGGNPAFADAADTQLNEIFGPGKLKQLPDNSPIYVQPDNKIQKVAWRQFALGRISDHKHARIAGVTIGNRLAVFFSREDLSAGLVGQPVDGIIGYDPETATHLMAGMLLYAAGK